MESLAEGFKKMIGLYLFIYIFNTFYKLLLSL